MKLAILPGSFKPPHLGHFTLLKKLLDDKSIDKIYVIISTKSRLLDPNNPKKGEITANQSEKIWNIYLDKLLSKNKIKNKKLTIMQSRLPSPIMMAYAIADRSLKFGDELILVKSSKDKENKRFQSFNKIKNKGIKTEIWSLPQFDTLNSTNMRKTILNKDKKNFMKFLPSNLSPKNKNNIYKILI